MRVSGARASPTRPSGSGASTPRIRRGPAAPPAPPAPAGAVQPSRPRATAAPPAPVADPRPLDLNHASAGEISRLPGVGPSLARRIVEERDRRGRFESADSLRGILGMGPKKLAALREHVTVGE